MRRLDHQTTPANGRTTTAGKVTNYTGTGISDAGGLDGSPAV
jgi:hypothetical protein